MKFLIFLIVLSCCPSLAFAKSPFVANDAQAAKSPSDGLPDDPERLRQIIHVMQQQTRQPATPQDKPKGRLIGIINGQQIFEQDLRSPAPLPKSAPTGNPEQKTAPASQSIPEKPIKSHPPKALVQPSMKETPTHAPPSARSSKREKSKREEPEAPSVREAKRVAEEEQKQEGGAREAQAERVHAREAPKRAKEGKADAKPELGYFAPKGKQKLFATAVTRHDCDHRFWPKDAKGQNAGSIDVKASIPKSISIYGYTFSNHNCQSGLIYDVGGGWMCANGFDVIDIKKSLPHFVTEN